MQSVMRIDRATHDASKDNGHWSAKEKSNCTDHFSGSDCHTELSGVDAEVIKVENLAPVSSQ